MSIYVLKDEEVFSRIEQDQKKHTDNLLLVVHELLNKAKLKVSDIQNLCVCIGPGSFTGIRVAISVCKGIGVCTGAKVFTCSNFDVFSYGDSHSAVYVLEAFSNYLYVRRVNGEEVAESCETIDEFKAKESVKNIYAENEKVQNLLKKAEIQSKIAQNDKIKLNEFTKISEIDPIYLRASQAEIEREKKLRENKNG